MPLAIKAIELADESRDGAPKPYATDGKEDGIVLTLGHPRQFGRRLVDKIGQCYLEERDAVLA